MRTYSLGTSFYFDIVLPLRKYAPYTATPWFDWHEIDLVRKEV